MEEAAKSVELFRSANVAVAIESLFLASVLRGAMADPNVTLEDSRFVHSLERATLGCKDALGSLPADSSAVYAAFKDIGGVETARRIYEGRTRHATQIKNGLAATLFCTALNGTRVLRDPLAALALAYTGWHTYHYAYADLPPKYVLPQPLPAALANPPVRPA